MEKEMQELTSLTAAYLALALRYFEKRTSGARNKETAQRCEKRIQCLSGHIELLVDGIGEIPSIINNPQNVDLWFEEMDNAIEMMRTVAMGAINSSQRNRPDNPFPEAALFNDAVIELTRRYESLCDQRVD